MKNLPGNPPPAGELSIVSLSWPNIYIFYYLRLVVVDNVLSY